MSRYICTSKVCPLRTECDLAADNAAIVGHVIYFRPPEEHSGSCPHYISSWEEGDQG